MGPYDLLQEYIYSPLSFELKSWTNKEFLNKEALNALGVGASEDHSVLGNLRLAYGSAMHSILPLLVRSNRKTKTANHVTYITVIG
jgi:hypothetical protein